MPRILTLLIVIGAAAGLFAACGRYQSEARNRAVEIAIDYPEVRALAELTGQPTTVVLRRLQQAGVTSAALTEDTLAGLEAQGDVQPQPHRGAASTVTVSAGLLPRIARSLANKGVRAAWDRPDDPATRTVFRNAGAAPPGLTPAASAGHSSLAVPVDYAALRTLGIGIDPRDVAAVTQAGLLPVGRIGNFPGANPTTMRAVLGDVKNLGIRTVIFQGLEVLGYRDQARSAAAALEETGLQYGQVEFGKQKGDDKLSVALRGAYVRVHSIGDAEMGTLDRPEMVERFVRAARERNIRLCYIRLLTLAGDDPVQTNADYIRDITKGIARGHEMVFSAAHLFNEPAIPRGLLAVIAVGVAAGAVLLLCRAVPLSALTAVSLLVVGAAACAGLALWGETGRKLVALLAALVFPMLACLRRDLLADEERPRVDHPAWRALLGLAAATAVTSAGILSVVGLLATRLFMLKATQFLGIKAAHAVPILLIGAIAIAGLPALDRPWRDGWAQMRSRVAGFMGEPARVGYLLLALVALLAFALVVARTGNDPGVGVSGVELKARSVLDRILPVRPRTKEFLVGHPAFVLALALWYSRRRRWALPLFVVGVLGQVSILNTFCHIHTPLRLSLIRDLTGLVIGAVIGLALYWLVERLSGSRAPDPRLEAATTTGH